MTMAGSNSKSKWWTAEETEILVENVEKHYRMISSKLSDTVTCEKKKKVWLSITNSVNSCGVCKRSIENVKKKWEDLKSRTKAKGVFVNQEQTGTGGGKKLNVQLTDLERRILGLLGETVIRGLPGAVDTAESSNTTTVRI